MNPNRYKNGDKFIFKICYKYFSKLTSKNYTVQVYFN